jgi:hypothetical protein
VPFSSLTKSLILFCLHIRRRLVTFCAVFPPEACTLAIHVQVACSSSPSLHVQYCLVIRQPERCPMRVHFPYSVVMLVANALSMQCFACSLLLALPSFHVFSMCVCPSVCVRECCADRACEEPDTAYSRKLRPHDVYLV